MNGACAWCLRAERPVPRRPGPPARADAEAQSRQTRGLGAGCRWLAPVARAAACSVAARVCPTFGFPHTRGSAGFQVYGKLDASVSGHMPHLGH